MFEALYQLTAVVLASLPADARILCVGAGTGAEILAFAEKFPGWSFTAVEPSPAMMDACQGRISAAGLLERCVFHHGYLETLPPSEGFHAGLSILVSQFLTNREERIGFFRGIADRLVPGGYLVTADLSTDRSAASYPELLAAWLRILSPGELTPERLRLVSEAYGRDVAVSLPDEIEAMLGAGGFDAPVPFLQTLLLRAWYARR